MIQVTMDEAKERLPDLMDAAARGETVLIEKEADQGAQVVQLVAVPKREHRRRQAGSAKGTVLFIADDFDAPSKTSASTWNRCAFCWIRTHFSGSLRQIGC